ncbi:TPA: hypothetical protein DIV45_02845 [Patescibacteria group bacterium]|uniref:Uncharacterized protein n=1 Tax=candidate division Kazan bacterium GW2011_GWB1_45_10 TaxID=1620411 RepID=A0A0G1KTU3_UNCK3|nr:MAG: hypothetical protein VE97_C0007G0009 [candidate division Kazan bacterium GW2011_GWB1_45_10]HCR42270.1 hypothetical protein [Patescibacteria group bacterium]
MTSAVMVPLKRILKFLDWWAMGVPTAILIGTKNVLVDFDEGLQLVANFRLWLSVEPMFGDYTWSGRAVGFLLRGARLAMTVLIYILIAGIGLSLIIGWWLLPLILFGLKSNI